MLTPMWANHQELTLTNGEQMTIEEFYKLLEGHDWTYQYSDDFSVWRRGSDRAKQISHLAEGNETFKQMVADFRSYIFDGDATGYTRPKPLLSDYVTDNNG